MTGRWRPTRHRGDTVSAPLCLAAQTAAPPPPHTEKCLSHYTGSSPTSLAFTTNDHGAPAGHDRARHPMSPTGDVTQRFGLWLPVLTAAPALPRLPPDARGHLRQLGRRDELSHEYRLPRVRLGPAPVDVHHHVPRSLEPAHLDDLEPQLRHGRAGPVGLSPRQPPPALGQRGPALARRAPAARDRVERSDHELDGRRRRDHRGAGLGPASAPRRGRRLGQRAAGRAVRALLSPGGPRSTRVWLEEPGSSAVGGLSPWPPSRQRSRRRPSR